MHYYYVGIILVMYEEIYKTWKNTHSEHVKRELFTPMDSQPDEGLIEDIKDSKIAVYTAFTGDYDSLKEPDFVDENCDYICFTDNESVESDLYEIIPMDDSNLDNNRKAKRYKVLPHKYLKDYEYSFWLDGTFKVKSSLREYIYKYLKNPMLCVVHTERDCVYDELLASYNIARYPKPTMNRQVETYKRDGFPDHYGLGVMGSIFRAHNNPKVSALMDDWWREIVRFTNQDQLSFAYVAWKNDFHPSVSPVYYWDNEYWGKTSGENYHHKFEASTPLASDNLIDYLNKHKNEEDVLLKSEEIYLLLNDMDVLKSELEAHQVENVRLNNELNSLLGSSSWKITKPLRKVKNLKK